MIQDKLYNEILAHLVIIGQDESLADERNFHARAQAIDDLDFHIIDRIDASGVQENRSDLMFSLMQQAQVLKAKLENIDAIMFRQLRKKIEGGNCNDQTFINLVEEYTGHATDIFNPDDINEYDHLDIFINGLLDFLPLPVETLEREPEMVFYQKTPARIVFELVKKAKFQPGDVFFDLGSGLGQVNILVNLLASVPSIGVEFEPSFCDYARACAADIHLKDVKFVNDDARDADYSSGTVFFMYTPFAGGILQSVLEKLQMESRNRTIRIFTYGPCTTAVASQNWLGEKAGEGQSTGLSEFVSR